MHDRSMVMHTKENERYQCVVPDASTLNQQVCTKHILCTNCRTHPKDQVILTGCTAILLYLLFCYNAIFPTFKMLCITCIIIKVNIFV